MSPHTSALNRPRTPRCLDGQVTTENGTQKKATGRSKLENVAQSAGRKADERRGKGSVHEVHDRAETEDNAANGVFGRASRVTALVPAFNEEERIVATIAGLRRAIPGVRIVVADDGSTDTTVGLAQSAGADVERIPRNIGKGGALNVVFSSLETDDDDILLLVDADLGESSAEAAALLAPVTEGRAEMVVARFKTRGKGGFGLARNLGRLGIKFLGGYEATAPLSGQRALRAGLFREIGGLEGGYGMEVGLTIDVLRLGGRVEEVEVDMIHNETGRDLAGWRHRGRQFRQIGWVLLKKALGGRTAHTGKRSIRG